MRQEQVSHLSYLTSYSLKVSFFILDVQPRYELHDVASLTPASLDDGPASSPRGSVAPHEISTNYRQTKAALHNDSINLKCASMQILTKKGSLSWGMLPFAAIMLLRNTGNDSIKLAGAARGSRATLHTFTHKLLFSNKDNLSHITRHLQSHHSDRSI